MAYPLLKALHIIAIIAWMAGLFYLPRLFVYHAETKPGGEASEAFKVMERKLLKIVTTPAMIASWALGLALAAVIGLPALMAQGWAVAKLVLVVALTAYHLLLAGYVKDFARDGNRRSSRYYRIINEVPTLLMIAIVLLVVLRPF